MLERASSWKGWTVVNTMDSHHFFSNFSPVLVSSHGFSLNPPIFQYPLGILDARTGYVFPNVMTSFSDTVHVVHEGAEEGCFSAAPP